MPVHRISEHIIIHMHGFYTSSNSISGPDDMNALAMQNGSIIKLDFGIVKVKANARLYQNW